VINIAHCHSFFERFRGFRDALWDNNLELNAEYCLTQKDIFSDTKHLVDTIKKIPELPELLICANDFVCLDLMKAFKELQIAIPRDILITGFDNSSESKIVEPPLTTVHIPSNAMGFQAAELLLSRIEEPGLPFRSVYVRTITKYRKSSEKII